MTPQAAGALNLAIHAVDQALSEPDKKIGPAGVPQLIKFRVTITSPSFHSQVLDASFHYKY